MRENVSIGQIVLCVPINLHIEHTNRIPFYWSHLLRKQYQTNQTPATTKRTQIIVNDGICRTAIFTTTVHCLCGGLSPSLQGIPSFTAWQTLTEEWKKKAHTTASSANNSNGMCNTTRIINKNIKPYYKSTFQTTIFQYEAIAEGTMKIRSKIQTHPF